MRSKLILALLAVNVVLLLSLVAVNLWQAPSAYAQVAGGGTDYLVLNAKIGDTWDGLYIIDLSKRRLVSLRFDKTTKKLTACRGRLLDRDFKADR
jgi:hypothetical protein